MKVLFTQKELETLKEILETISMITGDRGGKTANTITLENLIGKMERATASSVKKPPELSVRDFLVMARIILGPRLKEQMNASGVWYKQMQFRLDSRGINRAMANVALENCRDTWAGDIWVDTLINSLDKLAVITPQAKGRSRMGWASQVLNDDSD